MNVNIKIGIAEKESAEILVFYLYEDAKTVEGALAFFDNALNNTITELIKKRNLLQNSIKQSPFQRTGKSRPNASCWQAWERKRCNFR